MWDLFPERNASPQVELLRRAIDRREPLTVVMPTVVQSQERWHGRGSIP